MQKVIRYALGYLVSVLILAVPGFIISVLLSWIFPGAFQQWIERAALVYLLISLFVMLLGADVRRKIRANFLHRTKGSTGVKHSLTRLLMNYNGMALVATAGIILMVIPVISG